MTQLRSLALAALNFEHVLIFTQSAENHPTLRHRRHWTACVALLATTFHLLLPQQGQIVES